MRIGLFFGSFNPIHTGHLIIASFVADLNDIDQVWFVISPQNPLKNAGSLLNEYHRLHLVHLAIEEDTRFKASDIEFKLPKPSYTIDTLAYLGEKYPQHNFSIILGADSYQNIHKWKNHDLLTSKYNLLIYRRPGYNTPQPQANIVVLNAPLLDISATFIRNLLKNKQSARFYIPEKVRVEIESNFYYR